MPHYYIIILQHYITKELLALRGYAECAKDALEELVRDGECGCDFREIYAIEEDTNELTIF